MLIRTNAVYLLIDSNTSGPLSMYFLSYYSNLAKGADESGKLLYNITPKFHWLSHLGELSLYLHPRRAACMIDEDFVCIIKEIARSSSSGTKAHDIQLAVCDKYRHGMSYRYPISGTNTAQTIASRH